MTNLSFPSILPSFSTLQWVTCFHWLRVAPCKNPGKRKSKSNFAIPKIKRASLAFDAVATEILLYRSPVELGNVPADVELRGAALLALSR